MQMPPDTYFAGFFDGEGSIMILRRPEGRNYELCTKITQVVPTPLVLMQERFGGSLCLKQPSGRAQRPATQLQLAARASYWMLKALAPFLVVKDTQAWVAMRFYESDRSQGPGFLAALLEAR